MFWNKGNAGMHLHPSGSHYPSRNTVEEIEHLEKGHKGKNRCR